MKKLFLRYTTGLLPFIALATCAYTQTSKTGLALNVPIFKSAHSKDASASGISSRAVKNFNKTYKKAGNISWFVIQDGFLAEFKDDGIKTNVYYDRKGNNRGTIRSFLEDKLPKEIRHTVKSKYYDYQIYFAQEVNVNDKTAFLVYLKDEKSYKTIRVIDGDMDEYQAFDKPN